MTIKMKCSNGHLNEIDVEELTRKNIVPIVKVSKVQTDPTPETLVTNCKVCGAQIVIRKEQLRAYMKD